MKSWDDLKKELKNKDGFYKHDIESMEFLAKIIIKIVDRREELGYSQRDLANMCGLPQSSIARIESCSVSPNLATILTILRPLGLKLTITNL